jgi:glucose/arabinose dehydrogenase
VRWIAALLLALPLALGATPAAACEFVLGFAQIRAAIGPEVVGDCIEDEHTNPENGDALQRTTGGLLVWRRADNWTAFTDGYRTWVNGPRGLQVRLNTESLDWERAAARGLRSVDVAVPPRFRVGPFAQPRQLDLRAGFGASVFAAGLTAPRGMAVGPNGDVYVTGLRPGRVYRLPDRDGDGVADGVDVFVAGLTTPHGIAVRDGYLYVAEQGQVVRFQLGPDGERAGDAEVVVDGLPTGGNHVTRSIAFAPDGRLYVAAGSSCNVCDESDPRRAAVWRYGPGGGEPFARGLRNAVGLTIRPGTDELWAVNNERDNLGDDLPPETLYQVREGMDAGWPRCLPTGSPDPDLGRGADCSAIERPLATFPAHSAPLGLRFYDGTLFPAEYRGSLFVALHGSWNRSSPIGYEVVQVPFEGGRPGSPRPFASGFLPASGVRADVWARPVDPVVARDGALLISDDDGGAIVRIAPVR